MPAGQGAYGTAELAISADLQRGVNLSGQQSLDERPDSSVVCQRPKITQAHRAVSLRSDVVREACPRRRAAAWHPKKWDVSGTEIFFGFLAQPDASVEAPKHLAIGCVHRFEPSAKLFPTAARTTQVGAVQQEQDQLRTFWMTAQPKQELVVN